MTIKALKLLLSIQAKLTCWFVGLWALIMVIILIVFSYAKIDGAPGILIFAMYTPKIYLLVMGIVYPPIATRLYVSRGLTRKQFFWSYTGAISIISLFLVIPILASVIYFDRISLPSAITHYLHMLLFFLIGWTSIVGFQLRKWYTAILGVLGGIAMFYATTAVTGIVSSSDLAVLGSVLLLLAAVLLILPRIIAQIPLHT